MKFVYTCPSQELETLHVVLHEFFSEISFSSFLNFPTLWKVRAFWILCVLLEKEACTFTMKERKSLR
jgi:hypothetical protein